MLQNLKLDPLGEEFNSAAAYGVRWVTKSNEVCPLMRMSASTWATELRELPAAISAPTSEKPGMRPADWRVSLTDLVQADPRV